MPLRPTYPLETDETGELARAQRTNNMSHAPALLAAQKLGKAVVPKGTFAKGGSAAGGGVGRAIGKALGNENRGKKIGSAIGKFFGSTLAKAVGFGSYTVQENSLWNKGGVVGEGQPIPTFRAADAATVVCHTEYVGQVLVPTSPEDFNLVSYSLNPSSALFPWLRSMAQSFQQFRIVGMLIFFESMTSEVATGGPMGQVILATDYDILNPVFEDARHMLNSQYSTSAKPSRSQVHAVECKPSATQSKLLYLSTPAGGDERLSSLGRFQVATDGLPATSSPGDVLGVIKIAYEVEFYKPKLENPSYDSAKVTASTGVTDALVFGSLPTVEGNVVSAAGNTLTFNQVGEFLVILDMGGTGLNLIDAGTWITTDADLSANIIYMPNGANTGLVIMYSLVVSGVGQTLVFDASAATTFTSMKLRVAPYDATSFDPPLMVQSIREERRLACTYKSVRRSALQKTTSSSDAILEKAIRDHYMSKLSDAGVPSTAMMTLFPQPSFPSNQVDRVQQTVDRLRERGVPDVQIDALLRDFTPISKP